jgi:mRNA interferase RelE/StbE
MSNVLNYEIYLTPLAFETLAAVTQQSDRHHLCDRVQQLGRHPDHQGTPLIGKLFGYRSIRALNDRYRIIYRVEKDTVVVFLVGDGQRSDIREDDLDTVLTRFLTK